MSWRVEAQAGVARPYREVVQCNRGKERIYWPVKSSQSSADKPDWSALRMQYILNPGYGSNWETPLSMPSSESLIAHLSIVYPSWV